MTLMALDASSRELALEVNYADHMAAMAGYWMKRAQEAERLIPLLIHSAGGEIAIRELDLACERQFTLERWSEFRDMTIHFRVIASGDTHPKDGDVKQAPLASGAVGEAETPNPRSQMSRP